MRPFVSRLAASASVVVLSALVSCDLGGGDRTCTLIGCSSGLTVRYDSALPPGPVTVELLPFGANSGSRYVFQCSDSATCPAAVFPGYIEEREIQIRVTTARGSVVRLVRPQYERARPNGPDCEPTCVNGTATVTPP